MHEQLELPLFAPPTFEQVLAGQGVRNLRIVLNTRLKRGWHVRAHAFTRTRTLTVPAYLCGAPMQVKKALIAWAQLPLRPSRARASTIRAQKRELEKVVWGHASAVEPDSVRPRPVDPQVYDERAPGTVYELREVFDSVNAAHFGGELHAALRWGDYASLTSYQTTRRAPDDSSYHLITIAGVYDHPDVPRYAIESVMYHEMLHIAIPPTRAKSRRMVHGRAFRVAERAFPHYDSWERWQKEQLPRIIRSLRARKRGR